MKFIFKTTVVLALVLGHYSTYFKAQVREYDFVDGAVYPELLSFGGYGMDQKRNEVPSQLLGQEGSRSEPSIVKVRMPANEGAKVVDLFLVFEKAAPVLHQDFETDFGDADYFKDVDDHMYRGYVTRDLSHVMTDRPYYLDKRDGGRRDPYPDERGPLIMTLKDGALDALFSFADINLSLKSLIVAKDDNVNGDLFGEHHLQILPQSENLFKGGDHMEGIRHFYRQSASLTEPNRKDKRDVNTDIYTIESTFFLTKDVYGTPDIPLRYIIYIASFANDIFLDASILKKISLRLLALKRYDENYIVQNNLHKSLQKLDEYRVAMKIGVDVALVITKHFTGSAGYAWAWPSICTNRSNTVIQYEGLYTGSTVAHEIGHILGCPHDQDVPQCNDQSLGGIMHYYSKPYVRTKWSRCCAQTIHKTFTSQDVSCLKKNMKKAIFITELPGQWNTNIQCKMQFPKEYPFISESGDCKILKCDDGKGMQSTYTVTPLDGTPCEITSFGEKIRINGSKVCKKGFCTDDPRVRNAKGGTWSKWAPNGQCFGLQHELSAYKRNCKFEKPSATYLIRGPYCQGESSVYTHCQKQIPIDYEKLFKLYEDANVEKCRTYFSNAGSNSKISRIYDDKLPCELYCRVDYPNGGFQTYGRSEFVEDGSPVKGKNNEICINGANLALQKI